MVMPSLKQQPARDSAWTASKATAHTGPMAEAPEQATKTARGPLALPSKVRGLRMLAQTRRMALAVLPMGAGIGLVAALALTGLERMEPVVFLAETTGQAALVVPALLATVVAFESTRNE